ncbi:MAG: hypothetical protein FWB86_00130 [Treponema sp.]|nr:hypothetical protein [Treponema sp.]MCL2251541.1 hypothetical protein [Treponema sp.]
MKIQPEHQEKLDKIANEIFTYTNSLWVIKDLSKDKYNQKFNENVAVLSPHLNFRDAVFHYQKMYEAAISNDNEYFMKQYTCITEHLNRGLRDFAVYLCFKYYVAILHKMLELKSDISKELLPKLRHIYHDLKNIVVKIRISGQEMPKQKTTEDDWLKDMIKSIKALYELLDTHQILRNIYSRCALSIAKNMVKNII